MVVAVQSSTLYPAYDSYVLRYDTNGALDSTFGTGGVVNTSFTSAADSESASAVAVQTDGKIIVVGLAPLTVGGQLGFTVARLNSNGTFDPSFGVGGKVQFNFASNVTAIARDVVIQSNGAIVIAGD